MNLVCITVCGKSLGLVCVDVCGTSVCGGSLACMKVCAMSMGLLRGVSAYIWEQGWLSTSIKTGVTFQLP